MDTYHILITDDLSPQALERLEAAGDASYDLVHRPAAERLREMIPAYDALIIRSSVRVDAELLAATTCLKVIGRAGVGLDNVDIDAASLRGVIVMNTLGANTIRIDAQPQGIVLVMENVDVPGVIGRVGTLLGAHAINIAEWRLGRTAPGGGRCRSSTWTRRLRRRCWPS